MGKREEELYFRAHGLEVKTAEELNEKFYAALARHRRLYPEHYPAKVQKEPSRDMGDEESERDD